ncbi:hypothetical protein [Candidatus Formimonas warabiya]|uniref:Uncharacterized protein n=1 Tax=Formimonas warabiya TaxID=1761012 RepID=A0A3G1KY67_FORW1|nr:hypothetical protein [Candidatus Formimonas warabiya]ATW27416.1 hypothetical protein DCMF_24050 [Candidatus Formimonas warabiya]
MKAEIVLTPTESKKLICLGVQQLPSFKKNLSNGIIAIHPSSTTYFLTETMGFSPTGTWLLGAIREKGLCVSWERQQAAKLGHQFGQPANFPFTWVLEDGKWITEQRKLIDILDRMGPGDIYIKGCNALDINRNAGVLFANRAAGTIGVVNRLSRKRGFQILSLVGLEKLIPVPLTVAVRAAAFSSIDLSLGQKVGLLPLRGEVMTEDRALSLLTGAKVTPIAAGGLLGAQGATTMVLEGDKPVVEDALSVVQGVKGAKLPPIREPECKDCSILKCDLRFSE